MANDFRSDPKLFSAPNSVGIRKVIFFVHVKKSTIIQPKQWQNSK